MAERRRADLRGEARVAAAGHGVVRLKDVRIPADLADVSPGGCKLRIQPEIVPVVEKLIPVAVALDFAGRTFGATIVWSAKGLLGCRFSHQLRLDEVAALMAARRSGR